MTRTLMRRACGRTFALSCLLLLSCASALAAPSAFTVSANKHYWLKDGVPFVTIGFNRYDVWNPTDTAATNAQGRLVINAPAIPTMQALYVHQ